MASLYNNAGQRKYLTPDERKDFITYAENRNDPVGSFAALLGHTGCRISEALALTTQSVDFSQRVVVFRSLKKRDKIEHRAIPVPESLLEQLRLIHQLDQAPANLPLWPWSRTTAWRRINEALRDCKLHTLASSTPRGLRHSFGVAAISAGVPLNMVQRWLGHAHIQTTTIYTFAMGDEERNIANKLWKV